MVVETKAERINRLTADGRVDVPEVRSALDKLTSDEVLNVLGSAQRESLVAASLAPLWTPGEGRPLCADEDPAVMAAVGRCATSRSRWDLRLGDEPATPDWVHPRECGWCTFPLEELLKALDWFTWWASFVLAETLTWSYEGVTYVRVRPGGYYANPRVQDWASLAKAEQHERVQRVIGAVPA